MNLFAFDSSTEKRTEKVANVVTSDSSQSSSSPNSRSQNCSSQKRLETDSESSTDSTEAMEFYRGNLNYPVFSASKRMLSPEETVKLLTEKGAFECVQVCKQQPLLVEHHRTFIVDLAALKSAKDIKCDDMGTWRNNSANKFSYNVEWGDDGKVENMTVVKNRNEDSMFTLKREYFQLNHDVHEDVRKRIDTIIGK